MKKITLILLAFTICAASLFAETFAVPFVNGGDTRTFGRAGEPVKTENLYNGYMIQTDVSPAVLDIAGNQIRIDANSIVSIINTDPENIQLYLIDGRIDVSHPTNSSFVIYTPWGKYFTPEPSLYNITSRNKTETVTSAIGSVYSINSISNVFTIIEGGETKNMLQATGNTFSPAAAFTLRKDEIYSKGGLRAPQAPSTIPSILTNEAKYAYVGDELYNSADDYNLINSNYAHFLHNTASVNTYKEETEVISRAQAATLTAPTLPTLFVPTEEAEDEDAVAETQAASPVDIAAAAVEPGASEGFADLTIATADEGLRASAEERGEQGSTEYKAHAVDGGVKIQAYSNLDTVTADGSIDINALTVGINPFIKFANSYMEFRLNAGIDPTDGTLTYPWTDLNFTSVDDIFRSVGSFINDFNIENILHISRTRDLPLDLSNLRIYNHSSNAAILPFYLDADLKYVRLQFLATDILQIASPTTTYKADFSIIPAPDSYPFSLTISALYNMNNYSPDTFSDSKMIFDVSMLFPILNDRLNIGIHAGLPWDLKTQTFGDIWKLNSNAYYAGLDFSMHFGPFKMLVGADYNANKLFTGYLNKDTFPARNLSTQLLDNQLIPDLKAIVPYMNLDLNFGWFGFSLAGLYEIYLGNVKPAPTTGDQDLYNSWMYKLNAKLSAFIKPLGNDSLKISADFDFASIFAEAMDEPKAVSDVKQNWMPSFTLTSANGPIFIKGTLDFAYNTEQKLKPIISMLMSINIGSDYVINPSYYRARTAEVKKRTSAWSPIVRIDIAQDIMTAKVSSGTDEQIKLGNNFRLKPIVGVEHPMFAMTVKYEFSNLGFNDFDNIKSWTVGDYINSFVNQFRVYKVLNLATNSSYNIKTHSILSESPLRMGLELDLNLWNIFGVNSANFATNLDNIISNKYADPFNVFLGYKSRKISAYIDVLTTKMDWNSGFQWLSHPSLNVDMNFAGARVSLFFATSMSLNVNASDGKATFEFGMKDEFKTWDMLAALTLGYSNDFIYAELTGGVQQNESIYRRYDSLSRGYVDGTDTTFKVMDKNGIAVSETMIPFFNLAIGGNVSSWLKIGAEYNFNISKDFKEVYRDRLSAKLSITSAVVDFNAVLEKRGAFFGKPDGVNMWTDPLKHGMELAYKFGLDFKTEFIKFSIEYQNEFFGATIPKNDGTNNSFFAGRLTVQTSIGLL